MLGGGLSWHFAKMPYEMGSFYALVGGSFTQTDMYNFQYLSGKIDVEGFGKRAFINERLQRNKDSFRISEVNTASYQVEIDRPKDNQRILRETLDRMRKEDGRKVALDSFYRKKIVEYANVFENERNDQETKIETSNQLYAKLNNRNMLFENSIMPFFFAQDEEANRVFDPSPVFLERANILLHFKGETLEDIYASLDSDPSSFATKTAAVMRSRDQNLLRANLHLVRKGANSSFAECLMNEFQMMNILTENPHLCPRLFQRSAKSQNVFDPTFLPEMAQPAPDNYRNK